MAKQWSTYFSYQNTSKSRFSNSWLASAVNWRYSQKWKILFQMLLVQKNISHQVLPILGISFSRVLRNFFYYLVSQKHR